MEADLQLAHHAATVALSLAGALAVGASASALWLARRSSSWAIGHHAGASAWALAGTLAALLASMALLWLEAALMAEVPLAHAAPAACSMATATHYGLAWRIGMAALAIAAACAALGFFFRRTAGALPWLATLLALAVFLYSRSMVSHAAGGGDVSWAVAADWGHLVFVSLWVGAVLAAGLITLSLVDAASDGRADAARYVQTLSRSATGALAGVVATGLFSAWRNLGDIANLTGNPYATALLAKLVFVGLAVALGGVNRFVVMPPLLGQLRAAGPRAGVCARRFALVLRIEAAVLMLVLILAALLGATSPPTTA